MDLTWLVAVVVFVGALAAAIKGLPIIWNAGKSLIKFVAGVEKIGEVPELFENQKTMLAEQQDFRKENRASHATLSNRLNEHRALLEKHSGILDAHETEIMALAAVARRIDEHIDAEDDRLDKMIVLFEKALESGRLVKED